jgi:hypothetical protein
VWTPPVSQQHLTHLTRLIGGIREADTDGHLITMHPLSFPSSSKEFHAEPWLDFSMVQTHVYPPYIQHLLLGDWRRTPAKPTLSSEPWYEREEALYEKRARIRRAEADGQVNASWYNPRTGRWHKDGHHENPQPFATAIPSGQGAPDHYYNPPGQPADGNDWVLVLEKST